MDIRTYLALSIKIIIPEGGWVARRIFTFVGRNRAERRVHVTNVNIRMVGWVGLDRVLHHHIIRAASPVAILAQGKQLYTLTARHEIKLKMHG